VAAAAVRDDPRVTEAAFPTTDRAAARALGSVLRRLGYDEDGICDLLGDEAYGGNAEDVPVHERRLPQTHLATAIRLLFLERPVSKDAAARAFGARAVEALEATGLAEVGDEVVPRGRITAIGDLLLASDGYSKGQADPPDYVATYSPTARLCDLLTPRARAARALDVGTGNGIHALLAARHSDEVVATDVNPRALAFTQLNAGLNALDNIECREGSLFEPVAGERFDLVTCNAPYVVSPERRWAYRDAGLPADGVSERVVAEAAEHLRARGYAALLVSWVATDEDEPHERAVAWVEATGCSGWVLPVFGSDPLDHAAGWNSELDRDRQAFGAAIDRWTDYLADLGIVWINEGAVLLHRSRGRPTVRVDEVDEDSLDVAGRQVRRAFAARARLAELRRTDDLLDLRVVPVAALRVETDLAPRRRPATRIHLAEGTEPVVEAPDEVAQLLVSLDGRTTLRQAIAARRLAPAPVLRIARELLEVGALRVS
jgi:methylase of polypeptide subunit release factors